MTYLLGNIVPLDPKKIILYLKKKDNDQKLK